MVGITCRCGYTDDYEVFEKEDGKTFCCPRCGSAWRVTLKGKGQRFESGLYIPPKQQIEEVKGNKL